MSQARSLLWQARQTERTGAVTYHLKKHHKEAWDLYTEKRTHAQEKTAADKKDVEDACEMSNSTVRFFDTRTNGGRQPYLAKVLPEVAEPSVYWPEDDPRAKRAHRQGSTKLLSLLSEITETPNSHGNFSLEFTCES